ncbi:MAG: class I SAM-dependent methyltransferase [Patescibacteria group bacterium]
MSRDYKIKKSCRICGNTKFLKVLDLGKSPLANAFLSANELEKSEAYFPLAVYFCQKCTLVSLRHIVEPSLLFKNYHYLTSASTPLSLHFKKLAWEVGTRYIKSKNDLVVEIGSNDGSLLSNLKNRCRVLGIDPADNVTEIAKKNGVETVTAFFSEKTAEAVVQKYGRAKVVLANNVIAHIDDLHSVFGGIKKLLSPDGVFIFEAHWVGNLITDGGFDQVYHEHLSYFSLHAIEYIVQEFGMTIFDATLVPIHGESLRISVGNSGKASKNVRSLRQKEKIMKLDKYSTFKDFAKKVERNKNKLNTLLRKLKKQGNKIIGYGAPAKGNTLLNYYKITPKILNFITDTTPLKQGLFTPGTHILILSPDVLKTEKPDYILLLSWNYSIEILKKESTLRKEGVKFIIPVPDVKIV